MDEISQLIHFHENEKIKFLKIVRGQKGANMVKKIWFDNKDDANEWFEPLNKKNYKYILLIYERKKITKKYIGFKFIVYNKDTNKLVTVVGQHYPSELFPIKF
jgi:hypothetical protein